MGPAPARRTVSGLPIGAELQPRREFEREAVGHPGDEVDDLVYAVSARCEVVEDRLHDLARACVLRLCVRPQIDVLEHE